MLGTQQKQKRKVFVVAREFLNTNFINVPLQWNFWLDKDQLALCSKDSHITSKMQFITISAMLLFAFIILLVAQVTADQVDDILKAIENAKPGDGVTLYSVLLRVKSDYPENVYAHVIVSFARHLNYEVKNVLVVEELMVLDQYFVQAVEYVLVVVEELMVLDQYFVQAVENFVVVEEPMVPDQYFVQAVENVVVLED
uniref:Uncharacterized protein n=1 Tax=Glossina brevipalpis TaxID=37001 RepID=A0A1A9W2J5_9MUSC